MTDPTWPAQPGTYALLFAIRHPLQISVGRLGTCPLPSGQYVYLGTARGPGGLRARITRHLRSAKPAHWHIDYLTALTPPVEIIALPTTANLECQWVGRLLAMAGASVPIPGFGSSDCRAGCPAHLIRLSETIDFDLIKEMLL